MCPIPEIAKNERYSAIPIPCRMAIAFPGKGILDTIRAAATRLLTSKVRNFRLTAVGLKAFREEALLKQDLIVSIENARWKEGDLEILPWQDFLTTLWQDLYT